MYTLTLTAGERKAIDWVGYRYANGDDLYKALWCHCTVTPEDAEWDYNGDITFTIPEAFAWRIAKLRDIEDGWPCFAPELCEKLDALCHSLT